MTVQPGIENGKDAIGDRLLDRAVFLHRSRSRRLNHVIDSRQEFGCEEPASSSSEMTIERGQARGRWDLQVKRSKYREQRHLDTLQEW